MSFLRRLVGLFRKPEREAAFQPESVVDAWRLAFIDPIVADLDPAVRPAGQVLQLRIELEGVKPAIWRRVAVPDDIGLKKLHSVIQAAMGWHNCHGHGYEISDHRFARQAPLVQILDYARRQSLALVYCYDPGDSWQHRIDFERTLAPDAVPQLPYCLDGANACPPEDCGGVLGYADFVHAITHPRPSKRKAKLEWYGGPFDPLAYDRAASNRRMRRIKLTPPAEPRQRAAKGKQPSKPT